MEWVIKALCNKQIPKGSDKYNYKVDSRRLKYCNDCNRVWENDEQNQCLTYSDFPSIGLRRANCVYCDQI